MCESWDEGSEEEKKIADEEKGWWKVKERTRHNERGVASSATEVDKATLSEEDDVVSVLEGVAVNLGLDVDLLSVVLEPLDVDLGIKVTDVANNAVVLHHLEVLASNDVVAVGMRNEWGMECENEVKDNESEAADSK